MADIFPEVFYRSIFDDICELSPSNKDIIRNTIKDKHRGVLDEYSKKHDNEKNTILEYFSNRANEKKIEAETTQSWTSYWAERRYCEYLLIYDILIEY